MGSIIGPELRSNLTAHFVDSVFGDIENDSDLPIAFPFRDPVQDIGFALRELLDRRRLGNVQGAAKSIDPEQLDRCPNFR